MKNFTKILLFIIPIAFYGCGSDDEEPDPRAAFQGSFEMEDFDLEARSYELDTTWTVKSNPEIEFDLDTDEVTIEIEEFVQHLWNRYSIGTGISILLSVEVKDQITAEISGNKFEIDRFNYTITNGTESFECSFEAEGELEGTEITMEFENKAVGEIVEMSGVVTGERK